MSLTQVKQSNIDNIPFTLFSQKQFYINQIWLDDQNNITDGKIVLQSEYTYTLIEDVIIGNLYFTFNCPKIKILFS